MATVLLTGLCEASDFNGDGKTEILWRHSSSGQNAVWVMNGASVVSGLFTASVSDPEWHVVGVGDFDGDGKADILWRHSKTGQNVIWLMNGATIVSAQFTATVGDLNWKVAGVGDLSGDGKADILWRHASTGENVVWVMNGATIVSAQYSVTVGDVNWKVAGLGDLNGDGKAEILWRHAISGQNAVWTMNGASVVNGELTSTVGDANWMVVGVGDLNGDGKADILWRHATTGQNAVWLMNGASVVNGQYSNSASDTNWKVVGLGDFNGDGKAEILWRHARNGQNAVWTMNGASVVSMLFSSTVSDPGWQVMSDPKWQVLPAGKPAPIVSGLSGNWKLTAYSNSGNTSVVGSLTQNGSNLSGIFAIPNSSCFFFSDDIPVTGTIYGSTISLTSSAIHGQVISLSATVAANGASFSGNYSIAGGCAAGDQGVIDGYRVSPISGTWAGYFYASDGTTGNVSANISQGGTSSSGMFPLTGSASFTNSACAPSGTITNTSWIMGNYVWIDLSTINGTLSYYAILDSGGTTMYGDYHFTGGTCTGEKGTGTLYKQ